MRVRPWIYIAGPYSGKSKSETRENCTRALMYADAVWRSGGAALCPHYNSYLLDDCSSHKAFVDAYVRLLAFCDGVLMLPKWTKSKGACREYSAARRLGKPIIDFGGGNQDLEGWIKKLRVKR